VSSVLRLLGTIRHSHLALCGAQYAAPHMSAFPLVPTEGIPPRSYLMLERRRTDTHHFHTRET